MDMWNNNHSVFIINYRLILTIKGRKHVITIAVSDRLKDIFNKISVNYNITLTSWNSKEDFIDIKLRGHPNTELSKFINAYKTASSKLIKKEFPELNNSLQDQFWSKSFCLLSVGEDNDDLIHQYLKKKNL